MEIILLRHGQTAGNLAGQYIGRTDDPLCDAGITALREAGTFPQITRVYVSPLLRAQKTAVLLFPNAEQIVIKNLKEMDFGDFEQRTTGELADNATYRAWVDGGCLSACPGGENIDEFSARTVQAFHEIINNSIPRSEKRVIIVAHGGSIMAIMSHYAKPELPYFQWHVKNCQGYRAYLDEAAWADYPALTNYKLIEALDL